MQVKKDSVIYSNTWNGATLSSRPKSLFIVLSSIAKNDVTNGNHIDGFEALWGYLKRKLALKGGIRQERLVHEKLGGFSFPEDKRGIRGSMSSLNSQ